MRRVLIEKYGIDDPNLCEDAELAALGLDSLSFVEYTFELESALHVRLDDLPRELTTVGDLVRFVHGEVIRQSDAQLTR
jgi:acyl carrier protein